MTRQRGGLQRLNFQTYNRPVLHSIETWMKDGPIEERLDLNPPYQRASVWTPEQRVNLIKSLMQGLPIGAIFLNSRDIMEPDRVVDGKQRIETMIMWLRGELFVPAEWLDHELIDGYSSRPDGDFVSYDYLSEVGRRVIANDWLVATYETSLKTVEAEAELYERINFGGTPHRRIR